MMKKQLSVEPELLVEGPDTVCGIMKMTIVIEALYSYSVPVHT